MSDDEKDRRDESDPQGPLERADNDLADLLSFAEEREPDPEESKHLHEMRERAERRAEADRRQREGD